jgi:hypothetical protein
LICSFIPIYPEAIDCHFDEPLKEQIAIEKSKRKINLASLPHLNLQTPADLNILRMKPIDMMKLCPYKNNKDVFDFKYVHDIARFAFYNGITFEEYLEWGGWTPTAEGIKLWNSLHKFPPFSIEQMKKLLQFYYPALKRDMHMTAFANQFNMPSDITITQSKSLGHEH